MEIKLVPKDWPSGRSPRWRAEAGGLQAAVLYEPTIYLSSTWAGGSNPRGRILTRGLVWFSEACRRRICVRCGGRTGCVLRRRG